MSDDSEGGPLVAYTIFRFDREEGEDVAYWYESYLSGYSVDLIYIAMSCKWQKARASVAWGRRSCRNFAVLAANGE